MRCSLTQVHGLVPTQQCVPIYSHVARPRQMEKPPMASSQVGTAFLADTSESRHT